MKTRARRRPPVAAGIAVLLVLIGAAGFGATRLTLGHDAAAETKRSRGAVGSSTTSRVARIVTTTTNPAKPIDYQVRVGDSLSGIARRFGISTEVILALNQLTDPNRLTVGETLTIPPRAPIRLEIDPARPRAGERMELRLSGALPGEQVTFRITSPAGSYSGPPHTAEPDGTVTAGYSPASGSSGTYTVDALGDQGTVSRVDVVVGPARGLR